jgi:hypothetical protein
LVSVPIAITQLKTGKDGEAKAEMSKRKAYYASKIKGQSTCSSIEDTKSLE